MRKDNQRVGSGLGCSMAYSHLAARCVVCRNHEEVLGSRSNILARMLRCRRIPDLTREAAVPYRIKSLDGAHTNRKSPPDEWIVLGLPMCRPFFGISLLTLLKSKISFFEVRRSWSPHGLIQSNLRISKKHNAALQRAISIQLKE